MQISPQGDGIKANHSVLLHQGNYSTDLDTYILTYIYTCIHKTYTDLATRRRDQSQLLSATTPGQLL